MAGLKQKHKPIKDKCHNTCSPVLQKLKRSIDPHKTQPTVRPAPMLHKSITALGEEAVVQCLPAAVEKCVIYL